MLRFNLFWNGFGFEGCVVFVEMLKLNNILIEFDFINNWIYLLVLIVFICGLVWNKMFKLLNVSKESMFDVILRLDYYKKKNWR